MGYVESKRGSAIQQATNISAYPLSSALTLRVIGYLNGFRLFIAATLAGAWYAGILMQGKLVSNPGVALVLLGGYAAAALLCLLLTRLWRAHPYRLALVSLLLDVVFLSLMLVNFGGLDSGLAVLLLFVAASAGILLPLRLALFVTALATLAIIGEAVVGSFLADNNGVPLLRSGLYGMTLFFSTVLIHALAVWLRDFRLIAERQAMTLSRLEQINELIIKRMRSGVLAIDRDGHIRMMNESAWFLLGQPPPDDRVLADIAPDLQERLYT
jgi:two-component system sensor histidine kinase PilS (NtrC family)